MNNVDAALVLLKNGANKDMQNNKVGQVGGAVPGDTVQPTGQVPNFGQLSGTPLVLQD